MQYHVIYLPCLIVHFRVWLIIRQWKDYAHLIISPFYWGISQLFSIWINTLSDVLYRTLIFWFTLNLRNWLQKTPSAFDLCLSESHPVVSDSFWPHALYRSWNSPAQNTRVGNHSVLSTQGSNPGLPLCRWILYQLSH